MSSLRITIIGTGFVGVVSAAVYASLGNEVIGLDIDPKKVALLKRGVVPFFEPDLVELLVKTQREGHLHFTTEYAAAVSNRDLIIIAVGTPSTKEGAVDLSFVKSVITSLAPYIADDTIIAVKSTVPPGTFASLHTLLKKLTKKQYQLAALPEFLREGKAVADTLHPDRIVIGASDPKVFAKLTALHKPLSDHIVTVSPESAQMGKYAANAYLATRITFINQIADLCERNGAQINEVMEIIGQDKRIGAHYLYPGLGYGGSCFPKDVNELAAYSRAIGLADNLFNKITELNAARIPTLLNSFAEWVHGWQGKTVAVLGLSFKPQTNDMREAPSTLVIPALLKAGATVLAFDPKAIPDAPHFIADHPNLTYQQKLKDTLTEADVIMALVEWPEIVNFDFGKAKAKRQQWFIDARNQFDKHIIENAGYIYKGIGLP